MTKGFCLLFSVLVISFNGRCGESYNLDHKIGKYITSEYVKLYLRDLKNGAKRFNKTLSSPLKIVQGLKNERDKKQLKKYLRFSGIKQFPKAVYHDGKVVVKIADYTISMNVADSFNRDVLVNGIRFRYNNELSLRENLLVLEKKIGPKKESGISLFIRYFPIMSDAIAGNGEEKFSNRNLIGAVVTSLHLLDELSDLSCYDQDSGLAQKRLENVELVMKAINQMAIRCEEDRDSLVSDTKKQDVEEYKLKLELYQGGSSFALLTKIHRYIKNDGEVRDNVDNFFTTYLGKSYENHPTCKNLVRLLAPLSKTKEIQDNCRPYKKLKGCLVKLHNPARIQEVERKLKYNQGENDDDTGYSGIREPVLHR